MVYYSGLAVTPTSADGIADDVPAANALVAEYGGTNLAVTASNDQLEGEDSPEALRILLEWPSKGAAMNVMQDSANCPRLAARTEAAVSTYSLIAGQDDLR